MLEKLSEGAPLQQQIGHYRFFRDFISVAEMSFGRK